MNRRDFLKTSFAIAAAPTIIPASALGRSVRPAANSRVNLGFIGTGGKGMHNIKGLMEDPRVQIIGVCDVDRAHLESALDTTTQKYGKGTVTATGDFRELNRLSGLDGVVISTPDHWHALTTIDALQNGLDCYTEKPLTLTIAEGRRLSDESRRTGRFIQTGSQQRSIGEFRRLCDLVRNGRIGKLKRIEIMIPANNKTSPFPWHEETPPEGFDYNFWLGPAPWAPYHPDRCHYKFRYLSDYSGGQVTNWGTHYIDIAQWCMGMDNSGPIRAEGTGEFPANGLFNVATDVNFTVTYANGVELQVRTRKDGVYDGNIRFEGSDGWIFASRTAMESSPAHVIEEHVSATDNKLPFSGVDHFTNYVDCIINRATPIAPAEAGHRSATVCHLGNIAMKLGRPLKWDPEKEKFQDDDDANRLRSRVERMAWA